MDELIKNNMTRRNLGFFINSLSHGGAERVVSILANSLVNDFDVTVILLSNKINFPIDSRINIIVLFQSKNVWLNLFSVLISPIKLFFTLKKNKIETLLVYLYRPSFLAIITKVLLRWKGKLIISERTYTLSHYDKTKLKGKIGIFLIKMLYNRADLIIPNSKLTALSLKQDIGIKTPITVIYNPITAPSKVIRKIVKDRIDIINVGNLYEYKNHEMLLRALSSIEDVDWHLHLVGSGPSLVKLKKIAYNLRISEKISFLGKVDSYEYYSKADIFISTSSIEGFPNALVEAMAHGLPVFSTDCKSGPREILSPTSDFSKLLDYNDESEFAEYGILVPQNNYVKLAKALNTFINNQKYSQKKYSEKALERSQDFSISKITHQYKILINDIIGF
jgi:glycosyltransferase involved in cell wall biosynthesis